MTGIQKKIKASIIGASGYTGVELIRLLHEHKNVELVHLIAQSNAGQPIGNIYPHLKPFNFPDLIALEEASFEEVDVVFCCLPHATTQEVVKNLPKNVKIIDLSADFRLFDPATYEKWYGHPHQAIELQKEAVYGLTELYREPIKTARIVACPGCYPTGASLPLVPLVRRRLIEHTGIIIDAKSGVSGMGRSLKQGGLFCEANEGVKAYGVCNHRHMPEIEQTLTAAAGKEVQVHFTPQLIPMSRGILSTIYVKLAKDIRTKDLRENLQQHYQDDPFVHILPEDQLPSTRDVYGTNNCIISVVRGRTSGTAVIVSVIDNLTKGSSGQALQNMNVMFGLPEETGLQQVPVFP